MLKMELVTSQQEESGELESWPKMYSQNTIIIIFVVLDALYFGSIF